MVNYFCPPLSWIADSNRVGVPLMRVAIACDRPDTAACTGDDDQRKRLRQTFRAADKVGSCVRAPNGG
jgi:hypothetical protein